jgi:hypothetical protein
MILDFLSWVYLASNVGSAILETSLHLRIGYLFLCRCDLRTWTGFCRALLHSSEGSAVVTASPLGVFSLMAFQQICRNSFARDCTQRNDTKVVSRLFVSATV